jgi:hypothetical protein
LKTGGFSANTAQVYEKAADLKSGEGAAGRERGLRKDPFRRPRHEKAQPKLTFAWNAPFHFLFLRKYLKTGCLFLNILQVFENKWVAADHCATV